MRELTVAELDLISGGSGGSEEYDNEDIVVTGSPYPPPYYPPTYYPPPYYYPPPSPPYSGGGGGGGGDSFPPDWAGLAATGEGNEPYVGLPHMEPGASRSLTADERIELAGFTNLSEAQLDAVRINNGGFLGYDAAATTISSVNINFDSSYALTDFSKNADTMDLLVHELSHVYQYVSGVGYPRMISEAIVAGTSSHNYYTYTQSDMQSMVANPNTFSQVNIETQAQIIQDLYRVSNGLAAQGAVGFTPTRNDLAAASGLPR